MQAVDSLSKAVNSYSHHKSFHTSACSRSLRLPSSSSTADTQYTHHKQEIINV